MEDFNQLFRKRIGFSENANLTFELLDQLLEKTGQSIPFENMCLLFGRPYKISRENLINKILIRNEGGLCYELNPILYFFLLENGFNVSLVRGIVYNHQPQRWSPTGRTHAVIVLIHDQQSYLIDTGFGINLPLTPVPLNGQVTESSNGEFRIKPFVSEIGDYILEMKLRNKDTDWRIGYCFDTRHPVKDESELDEIQQIISVHPDSAFNKHPLMTMLINNGSITLTNTSFTQHVNGAIRKEEVDQQTFIDMAKKHFSLIV